MAFTTLTNPKIILSLGPYRSILGTIIRPDPVLLKRKGGSNGEVTFNTLLPGAGEPLQLQRGDQDILCNWKFDDEEEPLPRGTDATGDGSTSGKKRKSPFRENLRKKLKENVDLGMVTSEEKVSGQENGIKKKNRRKQRWNVCLLWIFDRGVWGYLVTKWGMEIQILECISRAGEWHTRKFGSSKSFQMTAGCELPVLPFGSTEAFTSMILGIILYTLLL